MTSYGISFGASESQEIKRVQDLETQTCLMFRKTGNFRDLTYFWKFPKNLIANSSIPIIFKQE